MSTLKHPLAIEEELATLRSHLIELYGPDHVYSNSMALMALVIDLAAQVTRLSQELEYHNHPHDYERAP